MTKDVVEVDENVTDAEPQEQKLDPFAFIVDTASVIGGLGGTMPANDRGYAFHTPYVETAPGPCNFTIRFEGLAARYGTLQLRVHMLSLEPGAVGRMANMDRIALNRLVHQGGHVSIRFEGFRGYSFAVMGLVPDETDATAKGLTVALDRPADAHGADQHGGDGRTSAFGRDAARPTTHLISTDMPSFANPVCQVATARQVQETAFADWRRALAGARDDGLDGWTNAFVLQALRRYGMLAPEAHGIGFGMTDPVLANAIRALGPAVTVTRFAGEGAQGPEDEAGIQTIVDDPFPKSLVDFDFAFSARGLTALGSVGAASRFIEASIAALRPGGLAIHTVSYAPDDDQRDIVGNTVFRRGDMERIALLAISRGHEVAQIKIDGSGALVEPDRAGDVGAFGLILRRAPSIL